MRKLEAARDKGGMVGERRVVTMLFCDLKGSTAAAEGLDPEDWTEIMNGAFAQMIKPVYQYEGTIARLMGDALLAFFGAPIAHEDDPRRAVLAGLDIVEAIKPYRELIRERYGIEFDVRVGNQYGSGCSGSGRLGPADGIFALGRRNQSGSTHGTDRGTGHGADRT